MLIKRLSVYYSQPYVQHQAPNKIIKSSVHVSANMAIIRCQNVFDEETTVVYC
jgi:hypothetical protein